MPSELSLLDNLALWRMGKSVVTLGGLASGLAVVVIALFASRLAGAALRRLRDRSGSQAPSVYIVEKLVTYGLVVFGLIAATTSARCVCVRIGCGSSGLQSRSESHPSLRGAYSQCSAGNGKEAVKKPLPSGRTVVVLISSPSLRSCAR